LTESRIAGFVQVVRSEIKMGGDLRWRCIMSYIVNWEDHYEPGEFETEFDSKDSALDFAGRIKDDGGSATVWDENGEEVIDEDVDVDDNMEAKYEEYIAEQDRLISVIDGYVAEYYLMKNPETIPVEGLGIVRGYFVGSAEYVTDRWYTREEGYDYETDCALLFLKDDGTLFLLDKAEKGYSAVPGDLMTEYRFGFYPIDFPEEMKGFEFHPEIETEFKARFVAIETDELPF
jgi:hypothetical protein